MKTWKQFALAILWIGMTGQLAAAQQAPAEGLRGVADRLFSEGQFDQARPIYQRLLSNNPRDFHINRNLGLCFVNTARPDYNRAIPLFEAALAAQEDEEVRLSLARSYIAAGRIDDGLRFLRAMAEEHLQHPDHWREYAEHLTAAGRNPEAMTAYRAYLERRPGDNAARLVLARLLTYQGDGPGAMEQYQMVLSTNPRDIPARIGVARMLGWDNQLEESLRGFENVLAEAPRNPEALQGRAQALLWMGRIDDAEPIFRSLAQQYPNNADLRVALAEIERIRRASAPVVAPQQLPETIDGYRTRVARNPDDREAHQWLSEYYAARSEWPDAIRHAREVLRIEPDSMAEFRLGQLLGRAGSYEEAVGLLRGLEQRNPSPEVDLELAAALRWSGRREEALPLLDRVLAQSPDDPDALAHRGYIRSFLGQHAAAVEDFDRLLAQQPLDRDALLGKANALASLGDFDGALNALRTSRPELAGEAQIGLARQRLEEELRDRRELELLTAGGEAAEQVLRDRLARDPMDADSAYGLGERAAARANYVEAVNFLRQALAAHPDMAAARLRLAQVLSFNQSYTDSINEYDRLLQDDPGNQQVLLESARVQGWGQNFTDSSIRYRRYLSQNPDPEVRLALARIHSAAGDFPSALGEYDILVAAMPDSRDVHLERARILLAMNRFPEAYLAYDQALTRFPNDPDMLYGKGRVLYYMGEFKEADRILSQAHQTIPEENPELTYTLANVAQARGQTGRALSLIPEDTPDPQSREFRSNILTSLRPELRLLFAGEHATEFLSERPIDSDLGLRIYRGNARLSFWLTPDVRAQLDFNSIPSFADEGSFLAGFGDSAVSNSTLFTLSGEITPRIRWTAGGGGNVQTSGTEKLLGLASLSFEVAPSSFLTLEAERMMIDYTPRAVALNVSRNEYRAGWDTVLNNRLRLNVNFARGQYSTGNHSTGGAGTVEVLFPMQGGRNFAIGYSYQAIGFTRAFNAGFFTPDLSQRHVLVSRLSGPLARNLQYEFHGTLGPQKSTFINGDPRLDEYTLSGTVGGSLNWNITESTLAGAGYDYAKSAYNTGSYRSHNFIVFWRFRF